MSDDSTSEEGGNAAPQRKAKKASFRNKAKSLLKKEENLRPLLPTLSLCWSLCVGLGTLGIFLTAYMTLRSNLHKQSLADDDARTTELNVLYQNLVSTEDRYGSNNGKLTHLDADGKLHDIKLRIAAETKGDSFEVTFRLPLMAQVIGHTEESRSRIVDVEGKPVQQSYTVTVEQVRLVPVRAEVSAFGCLSCNSRSRLDDYLTAKSAFDDIEALPIVYVTLARGAIDFGELSAADSYLEKSMELLPRITSVVELARTKEEIGKTFMIMQAFQKGADYIEQAKEHWRSSRLDFQVGGLHDILIWEAQFASSKGDHRTAELRLEEMSKVVSIYDLSQSKCSSIIHDAYGVCLALLANSNSSDPSLPIPFEYREYHPAFSGWVRPAELVQIFDQTKLLPIGIEIVDSKELSDTKESLRLANENISEFNSAVSRVLDRLHTNDSVEDSEGTGQSVLDNPETADSQH